jgi:DNA-binding LacI/PurR family transcriptional regulator
MPRPRLQTSIFSLAKEFEVSAPTISKALSNSNEVSDALRARVRARAEELGFRPTRPRRMTLNICAVLDMEFFNKFRISGYHEAVFEGIHRFCDEKEVEFSLYAQTTDRLESVNLMRELHSRNADAAVVIGASTERSYFNELRKTRFPFCCIFDGPEDLVIKVDNLAAGRLGFDHLYELGHKRIAIARQISNRTASRERFSSFTDQPRKRNLKDVVTFELVPATPFSSFEWGRSLVLDWLKSGRPWTAVFCLAENVALGVLAECAVQNIRIPGDLSVLTCDDLLAVQRSAPPLSVVDIPNEAAGYAAAEAVWKKLSRVKSAGLAILAVDRVIRRSSTAPPMAG